MPSSNEILSWDFISFVTLLDVSLHLYISDSVSFLRMIFQSENRRDSNVYFIFSHVETLRFMILTRNIIQIAIFQILRVPRFMSMRMQVLHRLSI